MEENEWNEFIEFQRESHDLLEATLDMDEEAVAKGIEKIHMQYYFKPIRELPAGRGFADFVFLPMVEYREEYPALLVELKWNKGADAAIEQIKEKKYPSALEGYAGNVLLVGINYDKKSKEHQCLIEQKRIG